VSSLDDLLDNEHSGLHGETPMYPVGHRNRVAREKRARIELDALRARIAELEMIAYKTLYFMGGSMLKHHGARLVLTPKGRRTE